MDKKRKLKATKAKKVIPVKKVHAKKEKKPKLPRSDYVYIKIEDCIDEEKDRLYLFAVILEISSPYKMNDKFICIAKLMDKTVNPGSEKEFLNATFFARTKDDLPQPTKVGSIIRIHRGYTRDYKKGVQLNCDVDIKSAWLLFDPTEGVLPLNQTGKKFTWVEKDNARLKEIRQFAKEYFAKNVLTTISLTEAMNKQPNDFDPICIVLDVKKKDEKVRYLLVDEGKIVKLTVDQGRFPSVGPQDVVKLRAAYYVDKSFKEIKFELYSNMMRIPKEYLNAKNLHSALKGKKVPDEIKSLLEVYTPEVDKEKVISKVSANKAKAVALKDLLAEAAKGKQKFFKISANVIEVGPKDSKEWIWVADTKTKELQKPDEVFTKGKPATLPAGKEYVYKLQLYVKDKSVISDSNMYIIFLCTIDGKGSDFINIGLKREKPTEAHYKALKKIYAAMTRPWNTLDLCVEAVEVAGGQSVFFVVDTQLTI
ncbi:MAG: hypothetical protein WCJ39_10570 [bacterium]